MNFNIRLFLFIFLFLNVFLSFTQELPPINSYLPNDYEAESQNWSISHSKDNYIYVANNRGLLEFNGANWQLYKTPNETIMRSVKAVENRIYTGFYMDFGFWEKNSKGVLEYSSIVKNKNISLIDDEQFWNIIQLDDWLLFQSLQRIYLYNLKSQEYKIISPDTPIVKMMLSEETVYFQQRSKGVYRIFNGKPILVSDDEILKNNTVVNIFKKNDDLLFLTSNKGFFILKNNKLVKWNISSNKTILNLDIYSAIQLKNKDFALGTISNGVISLKENGDIDYQISQENGLINNTVLTIFEDNKNTIWLGLDNGINTLNTQSLFKVYTDNTGQLGTVYTSILFKENLYLGTNQGLFYKKNNTSNKFTLIKNTQGQVWYLKNIEGTLFCGHNTGTYIIEDNMASKIANIQGTWKIKKIKNNTLIQGNYNGLNILEKKNNYWNFKNKIIGFNNSSRYFELVDFNNIFVNHEYKGVFKLTIDSLFQGVKNINKETSIDKGLYSSLLKYGGDILYGNEKGVFKFNQVKNKFVRDSLYSKLYDTENYTSGKLIETEETDRLWAFSKHNISYATPGKLSSKPIIQSISIPENLRKSASGFENISYLEKQKYLIGVSNGYIILNERNKVMPNSFKVNITSIKSKSLQSGFSNVELTTTPEFENLNNTIEFNFATPSYHKFNEVKYQYQLTNTLEAWSNWSLNSNVLFKNLPSGNYSFKVRSKVGEFISKNIAIYNFSIKKPWYLSSLMLFVYLLIFLLLYFLLHTIYTNYYRKQREQLLTAQQREFELNVLESEKELMKLKNSQLTTDIETKNRELASSTMNIIKKNEFLSTIKNELQKSKDVNIKNVIKIIDKDLNNTDDWKLFKEAFNNADKDFIKKVKSIHSNLTPNDLRLCAYLRLNLSSKEIAPLLNISARSVEVKRYRLRKKMNLEREANLTNYILEI